MAKYKRSIHTVAFMPAVEGISRKWARRKDTCAEVTNQQGQKHVKTFFGSGVRTKIFNGEMVQQNYLFLRQAARITPVSADEIKQRSNFSKASKWAKLATTSLTVLSQNQVKYVESKHDKTKRIQGVWAGDYGFRGFCFAVAMSMLGKGTTLPEDGELPNA